MKPIWLDARGLEPLELDRPAVEKLLPQRPPLLLVDAVHAWRSSPTIALLASLFIALEEPVLRGHFPGRPVWPGCYTIEGLAQTCALAGAMAAARPAETARPDRPAALLASVKVKLTRVVTPPARLEYLVEHTADVGAVSRFDVQALVDDETVAKGTLDVIFREGTG